MTADTTNTNSYSSWKDALNKSVDYDATATELSQVQEILTAVTVQVEDDDADNGGILAFLSDDFMPLRHLRAEKGNVPKAIESIQRTLKWRKEFHVDAIATCLQKEQEDIDNATPANMGEEDLAAIIRKENETGKLYVRGHDKDGRAVLYMRPGKENTKDHVNNMRHLVYHMEKAIACSARKGQSRICIVIDYDGFKLRHAPPLGTARYTLDVLQHHYPERLHRGYICNPPWIFQGFWKVVYPFIDPVTKQKIRFCTSKKDFEQVQADMGDEKNNLESCAGGTEPVKEFDSTEYLALPMDITFGEQEDKT
eukprot:scaffold629_cov140-Cylindrotheca_fusiformis.AAC.7